MGYLYTSGKGLCCDFCGNAPARKMPCPVRWCQSLATCAACRKAGKHREGHDGCRERHAELENGKQSIRDGRLTFVVEPSGLFDYGQDKGRRMYREIEGAEGPNVGFWLCSIFNRTWLWMSDIEQLRAWGNVVTVQEVAK